MKIKRLLPPLFTVVFTALILFFVVAIPLGVADGGGLYKSMERFGLIYSEQPTNNRFSTEFKVDTYSVKQATENTHEAFIQSLLKGDVFNVKKAALIYSALLIIALWLIARGGQSKKYGWTNWVLALLLVFMFADFGYTLFFNTLYKDALVFVLLLLSVGLLLYAHSKNDAPWWLVVILTAATLAFSFLGTVEAALAIILGVLIIRLMKISKSNINRYISLLCGVAVIVSSIVFMVNYKDVNYEKNIYNAVFFGVAENKSVEEIGLDPKLNELKGRFYTEDIAKEYDLQNTLYNKMSYGKIIGFYITHWGSSFDLVKKACNNAFFVRPEYLGNYTSGDEPNTANGFGLWSKFKQTFVPNTMTFIIILFVGYIGVLIYLYIKEKEKRPALELFLGLAVMLGTALKLPAFLGGAYEISRSLFTFNIIFDLVILSVIVGGSRYLLERQEHVKEKFGVTQ